MAQQKSNTRQAIFDVERKTKFSNSYSFPALKKELFLIKILANSLIKELLFHTI